MVLLSLLRRSKLSAYKAEDVPAAQGGEWICAACDEPNNAHRRACNNCGILQPAQSDQSVQPAETVHSPGQANGACVGTPSPGAVGEEQSCQDDAAIAAALQAEEELAAQEHSAEGGNRPSPRSAWPAGSDQADRAAASGCAVDTRSPRRRFILRVIAAATIIFVLAVIGVIWHLTATGRLHKRDAPIGGSPREETSDLSQEFENISRAALAATNEYRAFKGLSALEWHQGLASIAVDHAGEMAAGSMPFSHEGFEDRVSQYPAYATMAAENLGQCKGHEDIAICAVNGWILSPEHEQNLIGDFDHCGIGTAHNSADGRWFITQLFAAMP